MQIDIERTPVDIVAQPIPALLLEQRARQLLAPEDDMWATFGERAAPHTISVGGHIVGCCTVDDDDRLHGFHLSDEYESVATELARLVFDRLATSSAIVSTVEPRFLSLALTVSGGPATPMAWMYHHDAGTAGDDDPLDLRPADPADRRAAVEFYRSATEPAPGFLEPFVAERIELGELYLYEQQGRIAAAGEARRDHRAPGHTHLGLAVAPQDRGRGLGRRLMHTLTTGCRARGEIPLCSTEPSNFSAQHVIRAAGFRHRHSVFRVGVGRRQVP